MTAGGAAGDPRRATEEPAGGLAVETHELRRPVTRTLTPRSSVSSIADRLHLHQHMRVEDDRRAPIAESTDDHADVLTTDRIERRSRLVEHDKIGSTQQSNRQPALVDLVFCLDGRGVGGREPPAQPPSAVSADSDRIGPICRPARRSRNRRRRDSARSGPARGCRTDLAMRSRQGRAGTARSPWRSDSRRCPHLRRRSRERPG